MVNLCDCECVMKITISGIVDEDGKLLEDEIFEDVHQCYVLGLRGKMAPNDFMYIKGQYKYLIGQLYYALKDMEKRNVTG